MCRGDSNSGNTELYKNDNTMLVHVYPTQPLSPVVIVDALICVDSVLNLSGSKRMVI